MYHILIITKAKARSTKCNIQKFNSKITFFSAALLSILVIFIISGIFLSIFGFRNKYIEFTTPQKVSQKFFFPAKLPILVTPLLVA